MRTIRVAAVALGLALGLCSSPSRAADVDPTAAARALGEEGLALYKAGRWAEAYRKFTAAHQHLRAPTLKLFMARCQRNLGRLVDARALFESVVREPLPPKPSAQFVEAKDDAREELAELEPRIPSLRISVTGAPAENVMVKVDGTPVPQVDRDQPLLLDPGSHSVAVTAPGFAPAFREVDLAEGGGTQQIALALVVAAQTAATIPPAPAQLPPDPDDEDGLVWPGGLALGLGIAGLGLGVVTGGIAWSKADDIKSRCIDGHCPPEDQEAADSASTLATVSTVGFVVGGVGVVAGIVLVVVRPGAESDEEQPDTAWHFGPTTRPPADALLRVHLSPTSAGVLGQF